MLRTLSVTLLVSFSLLIKVLPAAAGESFGSATFFTGPWDNGSKLGIAGVQLQLKRRGRSKIIASTTSDQDGNFEFFPVQPKTRYIVIAKYQGVRRTVQHKQVPFGGRSDKQIEFP